MVAAIGTNAVLSAPVVLLMLPLDLARPPRRDIVDHVVEISNV